MTDAPEMIKTRINDRWDLLLPKHRATRPGWPWWERDALHALWCCIRPGDVVWDIGAEEGDLSALYASWGAQVCMVEPSPQAWPWIKATFDANALTPARCLRALAAEISAHTDPAALAEGWPEESLTEYVPDHGFRHLNEAVDSEPTLRLDDWAGLNSFNEQGAGWLAIPDVVVMDIEGAELRALNGAFKLLDQRGTTFAISVHPEFMRDRYGDTPDDLLVLMELAGYEAHYLGFTHEYHYIFRPRP